MPTEETFTMPASSRAVNEAIARVCEDHRVTGAEIARGTGFDHSHVSRILSGQHPVPVDVIHFLYRRTADRSLVALVFGENGPELGAARVPTTRASMMRVAARLRDDVDAAATIDELDDAACRAANDLNIIRASVPRDDEIPTRKLEEVA